MSEVGREDEANQDTESAKTMLGTQDVEDGT